MAETPHATKAKLTDQERAMMGAEFYAAAIIDEVGERLAARMIEQAIGEHTQEVLSRSAVKLRGVAEQMRDAAKTHWREKRNAG